MNSFFIRYDTLSEVEEDDTTACATFAFEPPLKADRGRNAIRLMITILFKGNKPIEQVKLTALGNTLAVRFYNSSGPITSALKGIIDQFNATLFEDNMSTTARGSFQNGHIVVLAMRDDLLYIVQSGLSKVFHVTQLSRIFYDAELAGKGAGLTSAARMYFAQAQVDSNDKLIVAFEPEPAVERGIESLRQIASLEMIQKRLFSLAEEPAFGAVFDFQKSDSPGIERSKKVEARSGEQPQEQAIPAIPVDPYRVKPESFVDVQEEAVISEEESPSPQVERKHEPVRRRSTKNETPRTVSDLLLRGLLSVKNAIGTLRRSVPWLVDHLTAGGEDTDHPQKTTRNLSIAFAVLLPIFVMIYTNYYYSHFGYLARYNAHLDNAADALMLAKNEADPSIGKEFYRNAISEIEKAKAVVPKLDERGARLLVDAVGPLDELEQVTRLNYLPALTQRLPSDHVISHMVVSESEIYLLDETDNTVIREAYNGSRFDRDKNFICGSNSIVTDNEPGKILALVGLPRGGNSANTVAAIDQNGKITYCGPGKSQEVESLPLPSQGIKNITAAAIQGSTLAVLDATGRAIWIYTADESIKFTSEPMFYFSDDIPASIGDAVEMVFNQDSVYLLNSRGELTVCSGGVSIVCNSPYRFDDPRPGMVDGTKLEDGIFNQAEVMHLPTASVLFLDNEQKAIFRFSAISLELQNKYLADPGVVDEITALNPFKAFAVNTSNKLFVLVDGQIYTTELFE